jgi:hypothetical protein
VPVVEDKLITLIGGLDAERLRYVALRIIGFTRAQHCCHPLFAAELPADVVARRRGLESLFGDVEEQRFVDCEWFALNLERYEPPTAECCSRARLTRSRILAAGTEEQG